MDGAPQPPAPHGVAVLIPAAGGGLRMGAGPAKALRMLAGRPVIAHTVDIFAALPAIGEIHIVAREQDLPALEACFAEHRPPTLAPWIVGGATRQDSVFNGLAALAAQPPEKVLVHDSARPLCSRDLVMRILGTLEDHPAVVPTLPIYDTVRRVEPGGGPEDGMVVSREQLRCSQTPQGFHWEVLMHAFAAARAEKRQATDCAALVQACGIHPAWIAGERRNIKLTTPEDLPFAEWALAHPNWGRAANSARA